MSDDKLIERLTAIKGKIERAKREQAQAEGRLESLLAQMKKEHGCATVVDADRKLKKLRAEEEKLATEITTGVEKLEEDYEL